MSFQRGIQYTALSRGEDPERIIIKNFDPLHNILAPEKPLKEMQRFENGKLLKDVWSHPLDTKKGFVITLLNLRSWNAHIRHFLSDPIVVKESDIFCFTETHVDVPVETIEELTHCIFTTIHYLWMDLKQ